MQRLGETDSSVHDFGKKGYEIESIKNPKTQNNAIIKLDPFCRYTHQILSAMNAF